MYRFFREYNEYPYFAIIISAFSVPLFEIKIAIVQIISFFSIAFLHIGIVVSCSIQCNQIYCSFVIILYSSLRPNHQYPCNDEMT